MSFWAYILHCRGGAFYTGHTDDLERRIAEHQAGALGGYTKTRLPVELVWSQEFPSRYEALSAELRINGWSRAKKLALLRGDWAKVSDLAKAKSSALRLSPGQASTSSARTDIGVAAAVCAVLLTEARAAYPRECCGLLLGEGRTVTRAVPCANVAGDPLRHFEIDPAALIAAHRAERGGGAIVLGYYHSHPRGRAQSSPTDRAAASGDGRVWAIIAGDEVAMWRDGPNGFVALSYTVIDG